jgi:hypothetical protein
MVKRKFKMTHTDGELRVHDDPRVSSVVHVNDAAIDTDKLTNAQYVRVLEMGLLYLTNIGEIDLKRITKS